MTIFKKSLLVILAVIAIGITSITFLMTNGSSASANSCTSKNSVSHAVTIRDGRTSPEITDGKLCDSLTITNLDAVTRAISFGPHEHHQAYDGVTEQYLNIHQSITITLSKVGNFHFHDHVHDDTNGYFNVSKS